MPGLKVTQVTYYFWIISHWAYLGGPRLEAIAKRHGVEVDFRPVRLLEIYKRTGGIPLPQRSLQRQAERVWELKRWRARLGRPGVDADSARPGHHARRTDRAARQAVVHQARCGGFRG